MVIARMSRQIITAGVKKPAKREKLKRVQLKRKKHRDYPVYLSWKFQEYIIDQRENGLWYIYPYKGGRQPKALSGSFTTFQEAHRQLVCWLEETDVTGQSRYPGCPERKPIPYTQTFRVDW